MPDRPPTTEDRRKALARRIGEEMGVASKRKRTRDASNDYYESQGLTAQANRGRKRATHDFDASKKRMVAELKAGGI